MNSFSSVAEARLAGLVSDVRAAGLDICVSELVRRVWRNDIDRHEPDELGDTAMSLGVQASVNLRILAERSFKEDPAWAIDGLTVASPQLSLQLGFRGSRIRFMKTPPGHGRIPQWSTFEWSEHSGRGRLDMAEANSLAVGGYTPAPGQLHFHLSDSAPRPSGPKDFLLVWSGDPENALTAGWLTVPSRGALPFLATTALWWDDQPDHGLEDASQNAPGGDSFDARPVPNTGVKLKRDSAREELA
jgi:hypothetical protein